MLQTCYKDEWGYGQWRVARVGIRKFLKGWCCRKNEGRGTMGTLSQLGSERREGVPGGNGAAALMD